MACPRRAETIATLLLPAVQAPDHCRSVWWASHLAHAQMEGVCAGVLAACACLPRKRECTSPRASAVARAWGTRTRPIAVAAAAAAARTQACTTPPSLPPRIGQSYWCTRCLASQARVYGKKRRKPKEDEAIVVPSRPLCPRPFLVLPFGLAARPRGAAEDVRRCEGLKNERMTDSVLLTGLAGE